MTASEFVIHNSCFEELNETNFERSLQYLKNVIKRVI